MGLYRKENNQPKIKAGNVDYSEINEIKDSLNKVGLYSILSTPLTSVNQESQLTRPVTDFDLVIARCSVRNGDASILSVSYSTIPITEHFKSNYGKYIYSVGGNLDCVVAFTFTNANTLKLISRRSVDSVEELIGIKL